MRKLASVFALLLLLTCSGSAIAGTRHQPTWDAMQLAWNNTGSIGKLSQACTVWSGHPNYVVSEMRQSIPRNTPAPFGDPTTIREFMSTHC